MPKNFILVPFMLRYEYVLTDHRKHGVVAARDADIVYIDCPETELRYNQPFSRRLNLAAYHVRLERGDRRVCVFHRGIPSRDNRVPFYRHVAKLLEHLREFFP